MVWLLFVVALLTTPLLTISLEREVWAHKINHPRHFLLMLLYQSRKWGVMCWCVKCIDFVSFYEFDIWIFGIVPTVWYFLELFRQCGIFGIVLTVWYSWNCSDSVIFLELFRQCGIFGIVPTVWYFWNCSECGIFGIVPIVWYFWNCSDSMVFLELFRQCGIFRIVPSVWYF
jgi:hypothetical protein